MKAKVECIKEAGYRDLQLKRFVNKGEQFVVDKERADYLEENNAVKILEVIQDPKPVEKVKKVKEIVEDESVTEKPKRKRTSRKSIANDDII